MLWRNIVTAVLGAWFVISAWALNPMHSDAYLATAIILGGLILLGSLWGMARPHGLQVRYYILALFGLYLGLTPFFYGFTHVSSALWVSMIGGLLIIIASLWQATVPGPDQGSRDKGTHHAA